jgi:hypothetical protein
MPSVGRHRSDVRWVAEQPERRALHVDPDVERIAEVTGQPTRWIVPAGGA